jgi:ADP-heptose:LPS heptosyltransferase
MLKLVSIARIIGLVKEVRRAKFDFAIDLHSLSEVNLLGFCQEHRSGSIKIDQGSLNYLANFNPLPPIEKDHRTPPGRSLPGCFASTKRQRSGPQAASANSSADGKTIDKLLEKEKAGSGAPLIGLFPGAGHPSRRWPLEQFAELADYLIRNDDVRPIVFAGPEERSLIPQMKNLFPRSTIILDRLTIPQLAAAQARLAAFVSNDTGPMHVAAAVGTPVVLLLDRRAPESYLPLGSRHRVIYSTRSPTSKLMKFTGHPIGVGCRMN